HDLLIHDVEHLAIHGGSLRLYATHECGHTHRSPAAIRLLDEERAWVGDQRFYDRFASRVEHVKASLRQLLSDLRASGKRIAAYGAAAKGSTLTNYCGIGSEMIDFVVDRSPHKQGRFMPGTRVPIFAPEKLLADAPDYVLLLTWNFVDEILQQ